MASKSIIDNFLRLLREVEDEDQAVKMTMSTNNCESMASYFTNSPYMGTDMHGHYPQNGVGDLDGSQQMHHYNQNQGNMPYPRFPPYDRMGYYNPNIEPAGYTRADSPASQVGGVMVPQQNGTTMGQTNQQQPVVYSCKLQAAVGGLVGMPGETGSPPLEQMNNIHMGAQMTIPHHMSHGQGQVSDVRKILWGYNPESNPRNLN